MSDRDDDTPDGINLEWTSADLERELNDAVMRIGPAEGPLIWIHLGHAGCDDEKILEVLRARWPVGYMALGGTGPWKKMQVAKTIHGGPTPAIWMGARKSTDWKLAPPTLQGLQLADRIRRVLGIPRAAVPDHEPPSREVPAKVSPNPPRSTTAMSILMIQIREARVKIREAQRDLDEASAIRAEKREALAKAQDVLEELLEEVENPGLRYPLLDRPEPAADPGPPPVPAIRELIESPDPEPLPPLKPRRKHAEAPDSQS